MRYPSLPLCALSLTLILGGCASTSPPPPAGDQVYTPGPQGREVALHALMLLQTAYRFGGKNPEAGLDCSGLVTLVYREAAGIELAGNAAWMARQGRPVERNELRSGDLVFFNTLNRPFSHVGIYLGRGEFIHAPNSRSRVRVDRMDNTYFAARFEAARTFFD
jgi:cell wall-associated NlpC family hydrolase